jgi:Uma2 family endonuclease
LATLTKPEATIADLYNVPENTKAELVNGEVVPMSPTGYLPGRAGGNIYLSLRAYERFAENGVAVADNVGFVVDLPDRRSFSPDAAYFTGELSGMRFLEGAPDFAVEVRSENDYGEAAEEAMAQKRADYFAAGTLVVWDVDLLAEDVIRKYTADAADTPVRFRRGEVADAEPAVPGWKLPVEDLFE